MSNEPAPNKRGRKRTQIGDCDFEGCDKPKSSKGLCKGHYSQKQRGVELRTLRAQTGGRRKGAKARPDTKVSEKAEAQEGWEQINYRVHMKREGVNRIAWHNSYWRSDFNEAMDKFTKEYPWMEAVKLATEAANLEFEARASRINAIKLPTIPGD